MSNLGFLKEVFIYLFQDKRLLHDYATVMFDHEGRKFRAVSENEPRVNAFGEVAGIGAEPRRGDEYTAGGLGAMERPDESLDVRAANVTIGIALGLDVDDIESQKIDSLGRRATRRLTENSVASEFLQRSPTSHSCSAG